MNWSRSALQFQTSSCAFLYFCLLTRAASAVANSKMPFPVLNQTLLCFFSLLYWSTIIIAPRKRHYPDLKGVCGQWQPGEFKAANTKTGDSEESLKKQAHLVMTE